MNLDELVLNAINETIEFDKKLEDPEFRKRMEIERKEMESVNLHALMDDGA